MSIVIVTERYKTPTSTKPLYIVVGDFNVDIMDFKFIEGIASLTRHDSLRRDVQILPFCSVFCAFLFPPWSRDLRRSKFLVVKRRAEEQQSFEGVVDAACTTLGAIGHFDHTHTKKNAFVNTTHSVDVTVLHLHTGKDQAAAEVPATGRKRNPS